MKHGDSVAIVWII